MIFDDVVKMFATVQAASDALGISHQAIYAWRAAGKVPPRARLHIIAEAKTRGCDISDTAPNSAKGLASARTRKNLTNERNRIPASARAAFRKQKANAAGRKIAWAMTMAEWWGLWEASGKWGLRGRGRDNFVMARHGDRGPYAVENVYITTAQDNSRDARKNTLKRKPRKEVPQRAQRHIEAVTRGKLKAR